MKIKQFALAAIAAAFLLSGCQAPESSTSTKSETKQSENRIKVKTSPDKYTWYVKNYVGKAASSVGYESLGKDRMEMYGDGYIQLIMLDTNGDYIGTSDEELKGYVIVNQNLEPNTEIKYTFEVNEDGEEYNFVDTQSIEQIVLQVKKKGSFDSKMKLTSIQSSEDKHIEYIRDYVGLNLANCGYESLAGDLRDQYGVGNIKLEIVSDDGTYIDPSDTETMKKYKVVDQSIEPNTEINYTMDTDSDGNEYNFASYQNIDSIELYVESIEK